MVFVVKRTGFKRKPFRPAIRRPRIRRRNLRPTQKRANDNGSERIDIRAGEYLQYWMPDEMLLKIFSYIPVMELMKLSAVCRRFNSICNDRVLRKTAFGYEDFYQAIDRRILTLSVVETVL